MTTGFSQFWIPTKPYSVDDGMNRQAAATGSVARAAASHSANFNGHRVTLGWNNYRSYYVAEYIWAGRNVVARSVEFSLVLEAAIREFDSQGRGACLIVSPHTSEDAAICAAHPRLQPYDPDYTYAEGKREGSDTKWRATWPDAWKFPLMSNEVSHRWMPWRARASDAALITASTREEYDDAMKVFDEEWAKKTRPAHSR